MCAEGETRTHTHITALHPKCSGSTSFPTSALMNLRKYLGVSLGDSFVFT